MEDIESMDNIIVIEDLSQYKGDTIEAQVDAAIEAHPVVVISRTWCPFSIDAKDILSNVLGVVIHVIEVNIHPEGAKIFK